MAAEARSIASLTLSFGLVSIPVRLYSATQTGAELHFNWLAKDGSRVKQQYISEKDHQVVDRADMVKGYEFEQDRFVMFTSEELKSLEESSSHVVEIVAFIPERSVDPLYYDKAYLLAPDKRGAKPYALLMTAMRDTRRCALAQWAWKTKQYVVQIRAADDGMILQQLRYADEVRSLAELDIEPAKVTAAELQLATQLIEQIAQDGYDPTQFVDQEKQRVLAAIDEKIAGKEIVASESIDDAPVSGQVIDLMAALRASLGKKQTGKGAGSSKRMSGTADIATLPTRPKKAAKRGSRAEASVPTATARRARAKK